ncbi:hypothetical protein E2C01_102042 [Portunus trituberculatus]|uniref:Uncharacterized protein n=1 Tax=Portunus trituberculatus TaxID=210409 RepID=A0A5B7K736_PORTR|nr:hypothetical protein [Portunus trituberculatus]
MNSDKRTERRAQWERRRTEEGAAAARHGVGMLVGERRERPEDRRAGRLQRDRRQSYIQVRLDKEKESEREKKKERKTEK